MGKIFRCLEKKFGMSAVNDLNGRIQNQCIDMEIVFRFVDESRLDTRLFHTIGKSTFTTEEGF